MLILCLLNIEPRYSMDNGNITINTKHLHCKGHFHWTVFFLASEFLFCDLLLGFEF